MATTTTSNATSTTAAPPASGEGRPSRARKRGVVALLAVVALVLTGCHEITLDYRTHNATSEAVGYVNPTTLAVGGQNVAAIDISLRNCKTFQITNIPGVAGTVTQTLPRARPTAVIRDANYNVVFDSLYFTGSYPGNAVVTRSDDLDHLIVPVAGFQAPLRIEAGCTTYAGSGLTTGLTWKFPLCTTWNNSCPTLTGGSIEQVPANWVWEH